MQAFEGRRRHDVQSHTLHLQQSRSIRMTSNLRQAIGALSMSGPEFAEFLGFRAQTNPFLEFRLNRPAEAGPRDRASPGPLAGAGRGAGDFSVEDFARAPTGLLDHVWAQISLNLRDRAELRIARILAEALEPSGWLGRTVEEIARDAGCSVADVEAVLRKVQQIEPAGLFARSLAECLRLQAQDADMLDAVMEAVLDNLGLVAAGRLDRLAGDCGTTTEEVAERLRRIRTLDPKPGAGFSDGVVPSIIPDLNVRKRKDGWVVETRNPMVSAIEVRAVAGVTGSETPSASERDLLEEARSIKRAAERREATMLRIAGEIVRRQDAFLSEGPGALLPLRLADVAEATGMHESTVSRITSDRHIETPLGVLPLRAFFSKSLGEDTAGAAVSASAVRETIRAMIGDEDKAAPLSDQRIAARLEAAGLTVARRTIAKYRDQLGLGNAQSRKRAGVLKAALKRR